LRPPLLIFLYAIRYPLSAIFRPPAVIPAQAGTQDPFLMSLRAQRGNLPLQCHSCEGRNPPVLISSVRPTFSLRLIACVTLAVAHRG
jgi:hypothetical protein